MMYLKEMPTHPQRWKKFYPKICSESIKNSLGKYNFKDNENIC